jgi:anti-sigma factor RsiW
MYENSSGERVTLYCAPLTSNQAALRYNAFDNFATVQWVEGGHGWAISGPADKSRLTAIAKSAYEQLENRTPPIQRSKADPLLSLRRS